ncbi:MAG: histidine phosphatase family protein [Saprospiraceae bacterium]
MSQLYFFRHAQASYLSDNYDQLSPLGEQQAAQLGKHLVSKKVNFDRVFVGPLQRQKHSFEIVAASYAQQGLAFPKAISLEGLREHVGPKAMRLALPDLLEKHLQIQTWYAEIKNDPQLKSRNNLLAFQYFMKEWVVGKIKVDEVQSWATFRSVVSDSLKEILAQTGKGETIAAFTSGGTIAAITAEALGVSDETRVAAMNFSIRNTSFSRFLFSKNQFNLMSFNELPHLAEEMITFV